MPEFFDYVCLLVDLDGLFRCDDDILRLRGRKQNC